jgi:hypothetical protein
MSMEFSIPPPCGIVSLVAEPSVALATPRSIN